MPSIALAIVALSVLSMAQESVSRPSAAEELRANFEKSVAAGPESAAGRELRRRPELMVPFLIEVLEQDARSDARVRAMDHLMRVGAAAEPAVPALRKALAAEGAECHWAVLTLGEVGPFLQAAGLREQLAEALLVRHQQAPTAELAHYTVRAWWRLQFAATDDVAKLLDMLRSNNPFAIELGCQLLAEQGAKAREALPIVNRLLAPQTFLVPAAAPGDARTVRWNANWQPQVHDSLFALVQAVDPTDPSMLTLLQLRLPRAPAAQQVLMVQQIGRLGDAAASAVPSLLPLLKSSSIEVVRETVTVLGIIGKGSEAARQAVAPLVSAADKQTAARAKAALRALGG
ncbi:MAG: hypothetical protein IPK26_10325 [Planctomycetes bacterium]|nr:hypothetical protein [Planctomycetota bacterium]